MSPRGTLAPLVDAIEVVYGMAMQATILSVVAVLIAIAALIVALRRRR